MMPFRITFLAAIAWLFNFAVQAQVANGGFEIPDPNRATQWYTPPMDWFFEDTFTQPINRNYVGLHTTFVPIPEHGQVDVTWVIPAPFNGEKFVLLSTGDSNGLDSESDTFNSTISQIITLCPGDTLYGNYFFGTTDYSRFEDTGFGKLLDPNLVVSLDEGVTDPNAYYLSPNDPININTGIQLFLISVDDVASYKSTESWQFFKYTYQGNSCQQFRLYFQVRDCEDRSYKSYLALDNVRICRNAPELADLNRDCFIDMNDLNLLARAWMADCNDPMVAADANVPCGIIINQGRLTAGPEYLTDISQNWLLDFNVPQEAIVEE